MIITSPNAEALHSPLIVYQNLLTETTISASSSDVDGDVRNALGPQTYDRWKPTAMPAWLRGVFPVATPVDCAALVNHDLGSRGVTVEVQRRVGAATWITIMAYTPPDDTDLLFIFEEYAPEAVRFNFVGGAPPSVGIAMFGLRVLIPVGVLSDYRPVFMSKSITLTNASTITGQFVQSRVRHRGAATSIPLHPQEAWWVDEVFAPFIEHFDNGNPFFWASCPELMPKDFAYCRRDGDPLNGTINAGVTHYQFTLEIQAFHRQ